MKSVSVSVAAATVAVWASAASAADPPPPYSPSRTFVSFVSGDENEDPLPDPDNEVVQIISETVNTTFETETGLKFDLWTGESGFSAGANDDVYERPLPSIGQRMVGSGISTLKEGDEITLVIHGLPEGPHALHTWHNYWWDATEPSNVEVTMDNVIESAGGQQYALEETIHSDNMFDHIVYFNATTSPTKVVFTPQRPNAPSPGHVVLNGVEIDNEASWWQIRFPSPAHHEEDVEVEDGGQVTASWTRPVRGSETVFLVYFGPQPDEMQLVANWTRETEVTFEGVEAGEQYYWRVDSLEDFYDDLFKGRTNTFTAA